MRFVDLFAGLGGFHVALSKLGHVCVLASEIDPVLQALYENNFGVKPKGDVRRIKESDVPSHDILCAGFPCQPFSKAGEQQGLDCPDWGDLFGEVVKFLRASEPRFFILENVPNLERHDRGATWTKMRARLEALGYTVEARKLSPHQFGVPQIRERLFIVGSRGTLNSFTWPTPSRAGLSIQTVLDVKPKEARQLPAQVIACLNVWQDFLDRSPRDIELPSFPIWSMEFGATYPYEDATPHEVGTRALLNCRGAHGELLRAFEPRERFDRLPSYAKSKRKRFPEWKIQFIRQNRQFYADNRRWIKPWLKQILNFPPSLQKFEWNCQGEPRDIWRYVIQFRASGVRAKRQTTAPSLVAMTTTQVPIIAWEERYMTPRECARLQSLDSLQVLPSATRAYKALGNAVNARVVELIARQLLAPANAAASSNKAAGGGVLIG
jgi:DNA (cytosine-5)-methyltransferase 1